MDNILIVTPIAPGTVIAATTLPYPRLISELHPTSCIREVNININRNRLQEIFLQKYFTNYDFILLLDSDVVVTAEDIEKLRAAWKPGTTPCINTKGGKTNHIVTSCALIHKCDYEKVDYIVDMNKCQCQKLPNPFYVEGTSGYEIKGD